MLSTFLPPAPFQVGEHKSRGMGGMERRCPIVASEWAPPPLPPYTLALLFDISHEESKGAWTAAKHSSPMLHGEKRGYAHNLPSSFPFTQNTLKEVGQAPILPKRTGHPPTHLSRPWRSPLPSLLMLDRRQGRQVSKEN